jgi:hypothetical protein
MAISSKTISGSIAAQFTGRSLRGRGARTLANAIGTGLYVYLQTPNLVSCNFLMGFAGPIGNISSIIVGGLVPSTMAGYMIQKAGKKLTGRDLSKLFNAISIGVCTSLTSITLNGTTIGVGVGSGTGSFSAVTAEGLSKSIALQMKAKRLLGVNSVDLANVVGFGIAQQLKTATKITVLASGTVAPVAPTGPVAISNLPSVFTKIA